MAEYRLIATGTVTEVYYVTAESPEEAKELFERGALGLPHSAEAYTEVKTVEEW